MSETKKKTFENRRYIGKVKNIEGSNGAFTKILIDNPYPKAKDGEPNKYYQGSLVWVDAKTGKFYTVKQVSVRGVSDGARQNGFIQSLSIDLDDKYEVEEQNK